MEEKPLCYAFSGMLLWELSVTANTIQSNKDVYVHPFSVSAKAENCISLYSSESPPFGRSLGRFFSGMFLFLDLFSFLKFLTIILFFR